MAEPVSFTLTGDAASLLAALSNAEGGFRDLGKAVGDSVKGALPDLSKLTQAAQKLADREAFEAADRYVAAVERIGGAARLAGPELMRVNEVLETAAERYRALGTEAPEAFTAMRSAVQQAVQDFGTLAEGATQSDVAVNQAFDDMLAGLNRLESQTALDALAAGIDQAVQEIEEMGGEAALSAQQQQGLADAVDALATQYERLGLEIPENLSALAVALDGLDESSRHAGESSTEIVGGFEAAGSAAEGLSTAAMETATAVEGTAEAAMSLDDALRSLDGAHTAHELNAITDAARGAGEEVHHVGITFNEMLGAVAAGEVGAEAIIRTFDQIMAAGKAVAGFFPNMIMRFAELADGLRDMSLRTGVSVEALSLLRFVGSQTGVSLELIARVVAELGKNLEDTGQRGQTIRNVLRSIGIDAAELKDLEPHEAFVQINEALGKLDTDLRNQKGTQIFGMRFRMMANLTQEDMRGMMKEAERLGLVIRRKTADDADALNDSLDAVNKVIERASGSISSLFMPAITAVARQLPEVTGGLLLLGQTAIDSSGSILQLVASSFTIAAGWAEMSKAGGLAITVFKKVADSGGILGNTLKIIALSGTGLRSMLAGIGSSIGTLAVGGAVIAGLGALAFGLKKVWDAVVGLKQAIADGKVWAFLTAKQDDTWARQLLGLSKSLDAATESAKAAKKETPYDSYRLLAEEANFAADAVAKLTEEQKKNILSAIRNAKMTPGAVSEVTGMDQTTIAELLRQQAAAEEIAKKEAQLDADRKSRGLTGTANAIAASKAQQDAAIKALDAVTMTVAEREKQKSLLVRQGESERASIHLEASRERIALEASLQSEINQSRIRIEKEGLQEELALIAERERAEIESAKRLTDGTSSQQVNAARYRAQIAVNEAIAAANKESRDKDIKLAEQTAETTIRVTKDGFEQQMALIVFHTEQRIAEVERGGMLEAEKRKEIDRIKAEAANEERELINGIAKKGRDEYLAEVQRQAEREIGLSKVGMDQALALEESRWAEEVRLAEISHEDLAAKELAHQARIADIRRNGDELTSEGLSARLKTLNDELALLERSGATYATLQAKRAEIDAVALKAAKDATEARRIQYEQDRKGLLDVINDEKRSLLERIEARRKLIDLDVEHATSDKEARQIRARAETALYNDMKRNSGLWSRQAIEDQRRVAQEARRAAGTMENDWMGALGAMGQAIGLLADDASTTFERIAGYASGLLSTVSTTMDRLKAMRESGAPNGVIDMFRNADSKGARAESILAGTAAVMQGVGSVKAATDAVGAGRRISGGITAGMQAGMAFGPWGAMAGAIVGGLVGALRKPEREKVMEDVGRRYGEKISEGLGQKISEDATEFFDGSHLAAELSHISDIIAEAGGLTDKNIDKFTANLRDTFVLVKNGQITAQQGAEILDKSFSQFAQHVLESNELASAGFQEIIRLNGMAGVQSQEIIRFVESQAARVGENVAKMLGPIAKVGNELEELKKKRDDIAQERLEGLRSGELDDTGKLVGSRRVEDTKLTELDNKLTEASLELHKKRVEAIGKERTAQLEAIEAQKDWLSDLQFQRGLLAGQGKDTADFDKQIAETTAKIAAMEAQGMESFPALDRAGRILAKTFAAAQSDGAGLLAAIDAIGPGLDTLIETYDDLGISIKGTAAEELLAFRTRINENREWVESADALNQTLLAMSNISALDAESFSDLQQQGQDTFNNLTNAGFTEIQSLKMMKGFLESVRDAHAEMGLPIDENVQKLIDLADANNILEEQTMSTNDVLMEGFGALIEAVGGQLPEAFKKFRDAAAARSAEAAAAAQQAATDTEAAKQKIADGAAWDEFVAAARAATGESGDLLQDQILQKLADMGFKLDEIDWEEWGKDGFRYSYLAKLGLGETAGAAATINDKLSDIDWEAFAADAEDAAQRAEDAINGVSFGHSPGGIKEIALQLRLAQKAAQEFAVLFGDEMLAAKQHADALADAALIDISAQAPDVGGMVSSVVSSLSRDTVRSTTKSAEDQAATVRWIEDLRETILTANEGREAVNLTFDIKTLDGADVQRVVENKVLPSMLDALGRGQSISKMRDLLR